MIVFDLKCRRDHVFEAWFRNGAAYETQRARGEIACPECGDAKVTKAPMAPRVARGTSAGEEAAPEPAPGPSVPDAPPTPREMLRRLRREIEARCENVGDRFAAEARKIHQGEAEKRDIYGRATPSEAAALTEEGVEFQPLPWPREDA